MSKSSFAVRVQSANDLYVVLGVTSIMPNMNGILLQTENRQGHQVEHYNMTYQGTPRPAELEIWYPTKTDALEILDEALIDCDIMVYDERE